MSYYLLNPVGRVCIVETEKEYQNWIEKGFEKPTQTQIKNFLKERQELIRSIKEKDKLNDGVYFATVSQGGKDGYSVASQKLVGELRRLGVKVDFQYNNQKVGILFHNPYGITRLQTPYKIIYTMFESTKIPDDWIDYLEMADLILVPSKWCADVFKKSGIKTRVVPLGFDDKVFTYRDRELKREADKDFYFLHYNAFNVRKGFQEVFKAFVREFKKDEPVKLVLKTTLDYIPLPITKTQYPNIIIKLGKVSDYELAEICYQADCFVFPSRGEGFGMTPLEAMGTGLPAIIPNAHGLTEYFNPDFMYEVKVKEECPAIYAKYKGIDVGKMSVCDVDDLRKKMRWVYDHQAEAMEKGKKASEYVKGWTYEKTAITLKQIIDEAMKAPITDKKLKDILLLEEVK